MFGVMFGLDPYDFTGQGPPYWGFWKNRSLKAAKHHFYSVLCPQDVYVAELGTGPDLDGRETIQVVTNKSYIYVMNKDGKLLKENVPNNFEKESICVHRYTPSHSGLVKWAPSAHTHPKALVTTYVAY